MSVKPFAFAVRFSLNNGKDVQVVVAEQQAHNYLSDWLAGKMQSIIGDTHCAYPWALQSSSIVSMHLYPVDKDGKLLGEEKKVPSPFVPPGPDSSGYRPSL